MTTKNTANLDNLRDLLFTRYGQPEGYGVAIDINGDELSGSSYRALDIDKMFSFDVRRKKDGTTVTTFSVVDLPSTTESWLKIWSKDWSDSVLPSDILAAAEKVSPGVYKKEAA